MAGELVVVSEDVIWPESQCFMDNPDVKCLCIKCREKRVGCGVHTFNGEQIRIVYFYKYDQTFHIGWVKDGDNVLIIGWGVM